MLLVGPETKLSGWALTLTVESPPVVTPPIIQTVTVPGPPALAKCKAKETAKKRAKCRAKAQQLPA
jgi:hypothetical protein